jgi:hypothetical protein
MLRAGRSATLRAPQAGVRNTRHQSLNKIARSKVISINLRLNFLLSKASAKLVLPLIKNKLSVIQGFHYQRSKPLKFKALASMQNHQ